MIDPVHFYALYGPGMVFGLALGSDGKFAFSLAGNMGALFPQRLIGEWQGSDPQKVAPLRQRAIELSLKTPSNSPSLPDSAFLSIGQVKDGTMQGGEYALYDLPETIAPVFEEVLALVHGEWLGSAVNVLQAECRLLSDKPHVRTEVTIESIGSKAVHFVNPLTPGVFKVLFLNPTTDDVVEPEISELRIVSDFGNISDSRAELSPGEKMSLKLEVLQDIPVGNWELHLAMELVAGGPAVGDLVSGIISWQPFKVVIPAS